jgi:uncharacterized protein
LVFKRRQRLSFWEQTRAQVYPRGGFVRMAKYLWHRLRRLPDPPHRVARGIFAGTFVNFPPIFGLQLVAAAALAWALRGNVLAALLATLLSNPITTPIIAVVSLQMGHWILGSPDHLSMTGIFAAFSMAGADLWHNVRAAFTADKAHWDGLHLFWDRIYFPYLIGSILPGLVTSVGFAALTVPLVRAYQALRRRRLKKRIVAAAPPPVDAP